MKLKLPRRRWFVLAGCLAVIGCGVLVHVEEAHQRYQRMHASYERVHFGMTPSEVRAVVGLSDSDAQTWNKARSGVSWESVAEDGVDPVMADERTTTDAWLDKDLIIFVRHHDGKAVYKNLLKRTPHWRLIANDWFARLRRLLS